MIHNQGRREIFISIAAIKTNLDLLSKYTRAEKSSQ